MVNQEHLDILKQGVETWNHWRKQIHSPCQPNLIGAHLVYAYLNGVDLRGANLSDANLKEANLREADLSSADLSGADLSGADLREANLSNANFSRADLSRADLSRATLRGTDLSRAKLNSADLSEAVLSNAALQGADLIEANLSSAMCKETDFSGADLRLARLIRTQLNGATLTVAHLWQTQRAGWSIKDVVCESIYLEEDVVTIFAPGEFERLYSDKIKIALFYKDGINPLEFSTLPALVKHLEETSPGCGLRLESISDAPGGAVVTLTVEDASESHPKGLEELKAELEATAKQVIEYQRKMLTEREVRLQLEGEVKQLDSVVNKLIMKPSFILHNQGDTIMGDTYNTKQAGAVGRYAHAHDMTFNQIGEQIKQSIDFSELASELAKLYQVMSQEAKESSQRVALGEVAKAEEAAKANDSSKVAESLKAAGKWSLDVATKIGTSLASEAIKQSMGLK